MGSSAKRKPGSLSGLLKKGEFPDLDKDDAETEIEQLQLKMLRIQQGVWHRKRRAVIVLEGFDAAGKGGAIRRLTERLDPRGMQVHPIGPPLADEQGKHWLYRFWMKLPAPGSIAIFDRSWYGRVLVERVDKLTDRKSWKRAYDEIGEFERMLADDGVDLVKIFLGISAVEQLKRFEERLEDPYKRWKIGEADIDARRKWTSYVDAVDELLKRTSSKRAPWALIPADHKPYARVSVLRTVTESLSHHGRWIEGEAARAERRSLLKELKMLKPIR